MLHGGEEASLDGAAVDDAQEEHGQVQRSQDVAHILDAAPVCGMCDASALQADTRTWHADTKDPGEQQQERERVACDKEQQQQQHDTRHLLWSTLKRMEPKSRASTVAKMKRVPL